MVAAAIAASNEVLPLVGGMALSDALLLGESAARRTLLMPKGCTMVSLGGNSNCIGGCTQSWRGRVCNNQLGGVGYAIINFLVEKHIQIKLLFVTASDLTAGAVLISLV